MALVARIRKRLPLLPAALAASLKQLVIEKLPSDAAFDLAVRDGKTGFTFFNIEGHQYDYDANAQSAKHHRRQAAHFTGVCQCAWPAIRCRCGCWQNLDRRRDATDRDRPRLTRWRAAIDASAGITATGSWHSTGPGCHRWRPARNGTIWPCWNSSWPGGRNRFLQQRDRARGLVCIAEQRSSLWFRRTLYRMSGAANNNDRFEQIGQSWLKHTFAAASSRHLWLWL